MDKFLGLFERNLIEPFLDMHSVEVEPLFIVGPPRSGTTVIARWLAYYLVEDFAYFSRLSNLFPSAVYLVNWVGLKLLGRNHDLSQSHRYGQIKGFMTMHEGNRLWPWSYDTLDRLEQARWHNVFSRTDYLRRRTLTPSVSQCLQTVFKKLSILMGSRLVLNKSTHNTNKIGYLKSIFPKARFICVIRDGRDVAKSLLKAREEIKGDRYQWWGVKPASWEEIRSLPPHISCGRQWELLLNEMEDQVRLLDSDEYLFLRYEDFLHAPYTVLETMYQHFDLRYQLFNDNNLQHLHKPAPYSQFFSSAELADLNRILATKLKQWGYT